jgi:hypothetical protein
MTVYRQIVPGDIGVQTPFNTVGNLLVAGPTASQIQDSSASSSNSCNLPNGLNFTNNINYGSGNASGPSNSWIYSLQNISGTPAAGADGLVSPVHFIIPFDNATASSTGVVGMSMKIQPGTGHSGYRTGVQGSVYVTGQPSGLGSDYVGIQGYVYGGQNLGGTAGALTNYAGGLFGGNSNIFTISGATFLGLVTSWEFDTALVTGSSAARKHGIMIVKTQNDAVKGTYEDSAIELADQDGATAWAMGLEFGSYSSQWAFDATSTLIGASQRVLPSPDSPIALWGIDFSKVTFQPGGGFLKSTGFSVDPSGNIRSSATGGSGYTTGAGGTVTQITSRTTSVVINKPTGAITMFSAAGSATAATFTVTNSSVAATDVIVLNQKSGTNLYNFIVTAVAAGSFNITFYTTGGTATDAPVINFAVIKGAAN